MKIKIATLLNPDNAKPMDICYNGSGEPMTAENAELVEDIGYTPSSLQEAVEAVGIMYGNWPWELEWEEM